jgi:ATPase subunit of ABC transporter with duplicated ATPase domains
VAALAGNTPEQLVQDLATPGFDAKSPDQRLRELSGDDRARLGLAIRMALARS